MGNFLILSLPKKVFATLTELFLRVFPIQVISLQVKPAGMWQIQTRKNPTAHVFGVKIL
jgi:hypothetical protein